jgi:hypothetical protein
VDCPQEGLVVEGEKPPLGGLFKLGKRGSSGFRCERRTNASLVNSGDCTTGDSTLNAPGA